MNYRHAFHAGNHADVLKHLMLVVCLERLKQKPAAFAVMDTHAGPGLYDLESDEARRSPEWEGGVGRLRDWSEAPAEMAAYLAAVRDPRFYPGSPTLIRDALREQDRLIACELHPEDAAEMKHRFRNDARVQTHARDGYEAMGALLPFAEKRGLVLIDPPHEETDEIATAATAIKDGLARFGHGVFLWWRPLKDARVLDAADAEIAPHVRDALRVDFGVDAPQRVGKLTASSMFAINPPYGLEDALRASLPALCERLSHGKDAFWNIRRISRPT